jgi:hypothetical protein
MSLCRRSLTIWPAPGSLYQGELDLEPEVTGERSKLMATIDALSTKYGKGMARLASSGIDDHRRLWGMRQERLSPGYTTAWGDMPIAKAVPGRLAWQRQRTCCIKPLPSLPARCKEGRLPSLTRCS